MLLTLIGAGLYKTAVVSAQTNGSPFQSLIARIAEKFNLKTEDVQSVFDEHKQTRQEEMKARFEERLSALVQAGKLTEAQKKLIMDKKSELMNKRKNLRQQHREELEKWAEENGIDLNLFFGGRAGKFGMRGGWRAK